MSSAQQNRFLFTIPEDVRRVQFCPVPSVLRYVSDSFESPSRSQGRASGAQRPIDPSSRLLDATESSKAKTTAAGDQKTGKATGYRAAPAASNPAGKQSAAVSRSQGRLSGAQRPIDPSSRLLDATESSKAKTTAAGDQKTGKVTGYRAAPAASNPAGKQSAAVSRSQGRLSGAQRPIDPSSRLLDATESSKAKTKAAGDQKTGKATGYRAAPAASNTASKQSTTVSRSQGRLSGAQRPIDPSSRLLEATESSKAKTKAKAAGDQKTGKATGYRAAPAASNTAGKQAAVSRSQGRSSGSRQAINPSSRLLKAKEASLKKRLPA